MILKCIIPKGHRVNHRRAAAEVQLYPVPYYQWVDFIPPAWNKTSSGTDLEDISHDMAVPCGGHIDVAIPVWSLQAGVTVFSGGKILLPFLAGKQWKVSIVCWVSQSRPSGCFLLLGLSSVPIITPLIQNEGEDLSSFANRHKLLLHKTSLEQG